MGSALLATLKKYLGEAWDEATAEAWTTTYGAVVDMMLNGIETDADAIPEEEEQTPQQENTAQFEEDAKFRPRKKLTYTQKVKLKDRKTLLTRFNRWFWASPTWTIALYATTLFFCSLLWDKK